LLKGGIILDPFFEYLANQVKIDGSPNALEVIGSIAF
jgi:hypothetical protein